VDPQLAQDALDVRRDRLRADDERLGDLRLRRAVPEQGQNLALSPGEVRVAAC
jgi:hypothetical protein